MIQVSVTSTYVRNQSGTSKAGKPYAMYFQQCWAHCYDRQGQKNPFPEKTEVQVETDAAGVPQPYAVGEYQMHPSSIYIDPRNFNRPTIEMRLVALKPRP